MKCEVNQKKVAIMKKEGEDEYEREKIVLLTGYYESRMSLEMDRTLIFERFYTERT